MRNYIKNPKNILSSLLFLSMLLCTTNFLFGQGPDLENKRGQRPEQQQKDMPNVNKKLAFEKNIGQIEEAKVLYKAQTEQATHFFSNTEIRSVVRNKNGEEVAYSMEFVETNQDINIEGRGYVPEKISYHRHNQSFPNVPLHRYLNYHELWNGVDATFYEKNKSMKYDFIVQPGTKPSIVQFKMKGVKDLQITKAGELQFTTALGTLKKGKPYSYQTIGDKKVEIKSAYKIQGDVVSFEIGEYDETQVLIIDPVALLWSTFLGNASNTQFLDMFVHPTTKNIYLVGRTADQSYPNTLGSVFKASSWEGIITCLSADGTSIIWSTFMGGSGFNEIKGVHVNDAGDVFLSGETNSPDFPVNGTVTAYDDSHNGNDDVFIMRLSPNGAVIKYSTFIGTSFSDQDNNRGIVVNGDNVYYTAYIRDNTTFPATFNAYQTTAPCDGAAIFCINTTIAGSAGLLYSTFLTPNTADIGYIYVTDMATDAMGNIYIMSYGAVRFPPTTANAVQTEAEIDAVNGLSSGSVICYVAKLDPTLSNLLYGSIVSPLMTNIPGEVYQSEFEGQIEVDAVGNIYCSSAWAFLGVNSSSSALTPAANTQQLNIIDPYVPYYGDTYANIICKIPAANPSQYEFVNVFSGNYEYDWQAAPKVDNKGRIHYFYQVSSDVLQSVTTTAGALQSSYISNSSTAMYTILSSSGAVEYSTVLGPDAPNNGNSSYVAPYTSFVTDDCKVYVAGYYDSDALNFPVTPTYHDFETGTQKTVYNSTPSGSGFVTVFHEPTPTNTINDFAPGNNTFCVGGLIYQNPNEGPIIGNAPGYTSGNGSSPTHNLPNINRNGTIQTHPTPAISGLKYQWEKSYNGTTWITIPGATLDVLKPDAEFNPGTVRYRRAIYGNCDTTYSNIATATIAGDFNLQANTPTTPVYFCKGSTTSLNTTITGATGNVSWQWYDGFTPLSSSIITPASGSGTAASFTANIAATATNTGFYRLVVTDAGGCKKEAFVSIIPLTAPAASDPVVAMCPSSSGAKVTLGPSAVNPDLDYQWTGPSGFTSNLANPTVTVAGTYFLRVKLKTQLTYCATGQTQVSVPAFQAFHANLTALSDVSLCQDDNPTIIGNGLTPPSGYVFQWSPGINLDDVTLFNPTFDPGVLPFGIKPIASVDFTFSALRLSDGCVFETTMTVTDTARAFADAGIDKPACGPNPSGNFGASETTGSFFKWRPVATTYPGGISALTSHPQWTMDGFNTAISYNKFLSATFPAYTTGYTIDFELVAAYTTYPNGCNTRDTVRLFYNPTCGGDWCSPLQASFSGTSGACSGSSAWIEGTSLAGLTNTWTTYSVNGVVQPANTPPQGLFEYNNGVKGVPLVSGAAHPAKVIVDFDDASWGWSGANVVVYRLTSNGNFGGGNIDCHKDIQVFSAMNAAPVVGVIDKSVCAFPTPSVRLGTAGTVAPYIVTGSDYTTAPNSSLVWQWGQVGSTGTPNINGNGNTPYPTLNPIKTTDFWVKVSDPVTGCPAFDTLTMKVVDVIANAGADITGVCQGSLVQIGTTAQPNHTYSWTPTSGLNDPIGTPNATTARPYLLVPNAPTGITYNLSVTETTTGCQATDAVTITTNTTPPPTPTAASYDACGGASFSIGRYVSGSGLSFSWSAGAGANLAWLKSTTTNPTTVTLPSNFSGTATFILNVTKGTCGTTSQSYTITNRTITVNLGGDVTASCTTPYTPIGVTAVSGYSYAWVPQTGLFTDANGTIPYTGQNLSQVYARPIVATTYTLLASRNTGCLASDEIVVNPPSGTSVNAGADKYWCPNSAAISIGTAATGTKTWSAVGYSSSATGTPTTPTAGQAATMMAYLSSSSSVPTNFSQSTIAEGKYVYRLTAVNGGCTVSDEVTVTVVNIKTNLAGTSQAVCSGESVQIGSPAAPATYSYSWSALNPSNASNTISNTSIPRPFVTPTTATTYQLSFTEQTSGCSYKETVVISIAPKPIIVDANSTVFCGTAGNQNLTNYISNYSSYFNPTWYKNAVLGGMVVTNPTFVNVAQATDFYLIAENNLGCTDTAQVTINVENPQTPIIPSNAQTDCITKKLNLANYQGSPSNSGYTLEWHSANNTNAATLITNTVVGAGTYYLFEKSPAGCYSGSDAIVVVNTSGCVEICDDGIDNDGDGLIDCDDTECQVAPPLDISND